MRQCGAGLAVLLAAGVWGLGTFNIAWAAEDKPTADVAESVVFGSGDRISGHIVSIGADGFLRMTSPHMEREAALRVAELHRAEFTPTAKEAGPHLVLLTNGDFIAGTVSAVTATQVVVESSAAGKLTIDRSLVKAIRLTADAAPDADANHETVLLANKDKMSVDSLTLADGQLNVKGDFGDLSLPQARASGIAFRASALKTPAVDPKSVRVQTERTRFTLDSVELMDDKALTGRAASLGGPVRIERAALKWVIFSGGVLTLGCGKGVSLDLVLIPAGEFMMGGDEPPEQVARKCGSFEIKAEYFQHEQPQHGVKITKAFYMGIYTVTQAQYEEVMGNNPSQFKGDGNLPVETVTWNDAVEFCKKLSEKTGQTVRLPTEAEWEYACRAGTTTPFNTGETISTDQANYNGFGAYGSGRKGEYREKTVAVGSFKPNAWGLYDMHGNVWQWCQDWYDEGYYKNSPSDDPPGPEKGTKRVIRGCPYSGDPRCCRSANRFGYDPGLRYSVIGIRVVRAPRP